MNNVKELKNSIHLLVVDDDEDDRLLIKDALEEVRLVNDVSYFKHGQELMGYLQERTAEQTGVAVEPFLILLDLNMPVMDGRETLALLKKSPTFRRIPVVVLTTSRTDEDVADSYDIGVNSFISKPVTFDELVGIMKSLTSYWMETVEVPDA